MRGLPAMLIAVALLPALAMPSAVGNHGGCSLVESGQLFVPTGTGSPWPFVTPLLDTIVVYRLPSFVIGEYWLYADAQPTVIAGTHWADFNIAFYAPSGQLIGHHNQPGNENDFVPGNADEVYVYMKTGPDPGTSDGTFGAGFKFYQGCGPNGPHL